MQNEGHGAANNLVSVATGPSSLAVITPSDDRMHVCACRGAADAVSCRDVSLVLALAPGLMPRPNATLSTTFPRRTRVPFAIHLLSWSACLYLKISCMLLQYYLQICLMWTLKTCSHTIEIGCSQHFKFWSKHSAHRLYVQHNIMNLRN